MPSNSRSLKSKPMMRFSIPRYPFIWSSNFYVSSIVCISKVWDNKELREVTVYCLIDNLRYNNYWLDGFARALLSVTMTMADAPRSRAYFERIEGQTVLTMPRHDWDHLEVDSTSLILIDVSDTPMQAIAHTGSLIACTAHRTTSDYPIIEIYRYDAKDASTPINKDMYSVLEDIPQRHDFQSIIIAASTKDDSNLRQYLSENVFLVKCQPGDDHWLEDLPGEVRALISST